VGSRLYFPYNETYPYCLEYATTVCDDKFQCTIVKLAQLLNPPANITLCQCTVH